MCFEVVHGLLLAVGRFCFDFVRAFLIIVSAFGEINETDFGHAWLVVSFVYWATWMSVVSLFAFFDQKRVFSEHRLNFGPNELDERLHEWTDYVEAALMFMIVLFPASLFFLFFSWPFLGDLGCHLHVYDFCVAAAWTQIAGLVFYLTHRLMHHNKYLYSRVHCVHHENRHRLSVLANDHASVWELLFSAFIPHIVSTVVARVTFGPLSLASCLVRIVIEVGNSLLTHCGYDFVPGARHHGLHHSKNQGNYGSVWLDWIFGTTILEK